MTYAISQLCKCGKALLKLMSMWVPATTVTDQKKTPSFSAFSSLNLSIIPHGRV